MALDHDAALAVLAKRYPHLKRCFAEYSGDGPVAVAAYLAAHPDEAKLAMQMLDHLRLHGPADT